MKSWTFLVGLAVAAAAVPASAWNERGHMMVAAKAWEHMSPASRTRVGQLLKHNPLYDEWVNGIPAADQDRVAFIKSGTWPDEIRSGHGYVDDGSTPPAGPNASRNIGYVDCLLHRYWHFKDLPFSPDQTPLQQPDSPNAETQIRAFTATLGDPNASDDVKSYDLAWLVHLVGDVHQPLHATSRFTSTTPRGDNGGNSLTVCNPNCTKRLHSYWDGALGTSVRLQSIDAAVQGLGSPPAAQAANLDPAAWLDESQRQAKSRVYRGLIPNGTNRFRLSGGYAAQAGSTAAQRVRLAGVRLARLIDGITIAVRGDTPQPRSCPNGV